MPKPINISEASPQQLHDFAVSFLGIDVENMSADTMLSTIMAANGGSETIFTLDEAGPTAQDEAAEAGVSPTPARGGGMQGSLGHEDPKVKCIINAENRNGETYDRDVEIGVNGRAWQLKRGVPLTIPYRVYLAALSAVQTNYSHTVVGNETVETASNAPRVPIQVLELPTKEEIDAWHEATDHLELV